MTHGDDDGLILPPRVASSHIVIIPILHHEEVRSKILYYCEQLASELRSIDYDEQPLRVIVDQRDLRGGEKSWSWIKKGVPLRIEIGLRDIESNCFGLLRRDRGHKEQTALTRSGLGHCIPSILQEIQENLLQRAIEFQQKHTVVIDRKEEFAEYFSTEESGGFALCHWNEDPEVEKRIKEEFNVTIRCIPHPLRIEPGRCVFTGEPSRRRVLFARAY
jgi:prolyl-tRNA synthetase